MIFERLFQAGRNLGRTLHPTSWVTTRDEGSEARDEVSKMHYVLLAHVSVSQNFKDLNHF